MCCILTTSIRLNFIPFEAFQMETRGYLHLKKIASVLFRCVAFWNSNCSGKILFMLPPSHIHHTQSWISFHFISLNVSFKWIQEVILICKITPTLFLCVAYKPPLSPGTELNFIQFSLTVLRIQGVICTWKMPLLWIITSSVRLNFLEWPARFLLNDLQSHAVHTRQTELLSSSLWWSPDRDYCHWYWWYKSTPSLQSLSKMMNSFLKTVLEKILFCFSLYQHTTRSAIPILSSLEFYARKVFAYCWRKKNDLNWKIEW